MIETIGGSAERNQVTTDAFRRADAAPNANESALIG